LTKEDNFDNTNVYFNTNPGMHWQVARLTQILPDKTLCLASDMENCYSWNILEAIEHSKSTSLQNIGLEEYCRVEEKLNITIENNKICLK